MPISKSLHDLPGSPDNIFLRIQTAIGRGMRHHDGSVVDTFERLRDLLDIALLNLGKDPSTENFRVLIAMWTQAEIALDHMDLEPAPKARRA